MKTLPAILAALSLATMATYGGHAMADEKPTEVSSPDLVVDSVTNSSMRTLSISSMVIRR